MTVSIAGMESVLGRFGLRRDHETKRKLLFVHPALGECVYLNRGHTPGLVIHPRHDSARAALASIDGVVADESWYHSSNMRAFPKRKNNGADEIPYGIQFSFSSIASLTAFLHRLFPAVSPDDPLSDIEKAAAELKIVSATERDALVKSRIGQGPFRANLDSYWKTCALTNCSISEALRASHIKPWRDSDNRERLDLYNGLLLTANLDALFDRGLISFGNDGTMLVSSIISPRDLESLGIPVTGRLRQVDPKHRPYLAFHRNYRFLP